MTGFSEQIVERLANASSVTVLTGAGASAESGLPTFRDPDGLWSEFNPVELASYSAFVDNPVRVQSWYSARLRSSNGVSPNPCHLALAELEDLIESVTVVTQNVDGLHQRAGSTRVIEVHGSLHRIYCAACGRDTQELDVAPDASEPARCGCGGLLRPGVVWFGEMLPEQALAAAVEASSDCDVFVAIGTSAEVYPAAALPLHAAKNGATVIEINLGPTPLSAAADEAVFGPAGELTPRLVAQVRARAASRVN
ncbi:MAG TPA: NAD-dependent deacylase [Rhodothermales bacterium]|nr:NAD-dependent deacylase [Rhodothermales bacterium]